MGQNRKTEENDGDLSGRSPHHEVYLELRSKNLLSTAVLSTERLSAHSHIPFLHRSFLLKQQWARLRTWIYLTLAELYSHLQP